LVEAAAMLKTILAAEFVTTVGIRKITQGTSPLGGTSPTTTTTSLATTTGLVQRIGTREAIEGGLTGERTSAQAFITEYATMEAGTHVLRVASLDWEVRVVRQLAGSHTEVMLELMGDG